MSATTRIQIQLQHLVRTVLQLLFRITLSITTASVSCWIFALLMLHVFGNLQGAELWLGYGIISAALVCLGICTATYLIGLRLRQLAWPPQWVIRLAQRLAPEQGSGLQTVVAFLDRAPSQQASVASEDLLAWHHTQVADCLEKADMAQRLRDKTAKISTNLHRTTLLFAWVAICVAALYPQSTWTLWQHWRHRDATTISEKPLVEQIDLIYRYPAYTQKSAYVREGCDGQIDVLRHTEVDITIRTDKSYSAVWMEVVSQDLSTSQHIAPQTHQHDRTTFKHVLSDASRYRFVVAEHRARKIADPIWHPVHLYDDAPPSITLDYPQEDLSIQKDTTLQILWRAQDDYGLRQVFLQVGDKHDPNKRQILWQQNANTPEQHIEHTSSWKISLEDFDGMPSLPYQLCASDDDPTDPNKQACSKTQNILLFSEQAQHQKNLEQMQHLLDVLVDTLAQQLDLQPKLMAPQPLPQSELNLYQLDSNTVLATTQQTLSQCHADTQIDPALCASVQATLQALLRHQAIWGELDLAQHAAKMRDAHRTLIAALEQNIIYLDDLLGLSAIHDTQKVTQELLTDHQALQEKLRQYRDNPDTQQKQALQAHLAQLKDKMQKALLRMQHLKKTLPGEFQNVEASSMQQMQQQLAQIEKQLAQEDFEQAAQELDALASMLEQMANNLEHGEKQYGKDRYSQIRQQLQQFATDFMYIEKTQQALRDQSQKMLEDNMRASMQASASEPNVWINKARQHAQKGMQALRNMKQHNSISPHFAAELQQATESYQDLDLLLAHGQMIEAQMLAEHNQEINSDLATRLSVFRDAWSNSKKDAPAQMYQYGQTAAQHAKALAKMFDDLAHESQNLLSQSQQQPMQNMQHAQAQLADKASQLQQLMQKLTEQMPLFDDASQTALQSATQLMQQSRDDLAQKQLGQAAAHHAQSMQKLEQLRQALEQAGKSRGSGLPLPIGYSIFPNPGTGQTQDPQSQVHIPKNNAQQVGPRYKQELLQAAQQKAAQDYEDAVRSYYNKLIR